MKVLIGITSKNRAQILPKAIEAAIKQTFSNKEVWIFDDASSDGTKNLSTLYPQVKWILSEEAKGLVWARNLFMSQKGFDYFCSFDDDAWAIDNTAIEKAVKYLDENQSVGALGFDMLSPDEPSKQTSNPYFIKTNNFIGCGHIINLKAAKEIGYYTSNPGFYGGEEKDFCIRLIDRGYDIIAYKGMYVWHEKTQISRNIAKQHESGVCNDLVFIYRRSPFIMLLPSIVFKILTHFKFATTHARGILFIPFIKGIKSFFKWLFKSNTYRKPVSIKAFKTFVYLGKKK